MGIKSCKWGSLFVQGESDNNEEIVEEGFFSKIFETSLWFINQAILVITVEFLVRAQSKL